VIAFIQRIYSRLTGVPSSAIRMEFDDSDTGDYGPIQSTTRPDGLVVDRFKFKPNRGRVDEDAATGREAQEENY